MSRRHQPPSNEDVECQVGCPDDRVVLCARGPALRIRRVPRLRERQSTWSVTSHQCRFSGSHVPSSQNVAAREADRGLSRSHGGVRYVDVGGFAMNDRDRRNCAAVKRFYEAERDVAAPDLAWHVPGHNPVSGTYRGHYEYFEVMPARMAPLTRWDFEIGDIMVNGDYVVATLSVQGERNGQRISLRGGHVFRLSADGQVAEGWGFVNDQEALDAFFSA